MLPEKVNDVLQSKSFVPEKEYQIIRKFGVRPCHDIIIYLPATNQIVIAIRKQEPAKGFLWPFGGGQKLGYNLVESAKILIEKESGIQISEIEIIGPPTDHKWSKGPNEFSVHDLAVYFTAVGEGEVKPNNLHAVYFFNNPEEYLKQREKLPHWIKVGMDRAVLRFWNFQVPELTAFPLEYIDGIPYDENGNKLE